MFITKYSQKIPTTPLTSVPTNCFGHVLNIDKVDVDIGKGFTKPYIKVTAVAGQGSDCILISWTKEQLNNALKNGDSETRQYIATKDLLDFGYITLDKFSRKWQIFTDTQSAQNKQFAFYKETFCTMDYSSCNPEGCKDHLGSARYGDWLYAVLAKEDCSLLEWKCICVGKYPVVKKGRWSDTSIDHREVTFTFSGINPVTETVSGDAGLHSVVLKDSFGRQKALIQWVGDLYRGIWVNRPTGYMPLYDARAGQGLWHFQENAVWNYMSTNFENYLENIKNAGEPSGIVGKKADEQFIQDLIDAHLRSYDTYFSNEPAYIDSYLRQEQYVNSLVLKNKNSLDSAILELDLTTQPNSLPTFDIYLDAEWVGIKKSVTLPRVECNQLNTRFGSGLYSDVGITVYNDGDSGGQIDAEVTCTNADAFVSPDTYQIEGNSHKTGIVRITGVADGSSDKFGTCTVTVRDHTNPSLTSSCTINYQIEALECNIGERKCSADLTKLLICNNLNQWVEEPCEYGCDPVAKKCNDKPTQQCPTSCNNDTDCIPCGEGWKCFNNRCMKETPLMDCKSCWDWAFNIFRKESNKCKPAKMLDKWYLPEFIEQKFTQDTICPFYLLFVFILSIMVLLIVILLIKLIIRNMKK